MAAECSFVNCFPFHRRRSGQSNIHDKVLEYFTITTYNELVESSLSYSITYISYTGVLEVVVYVHVFVYINKYIYINTYIHTQIHIYIYIYVCVCVCVCACECVNEHNYIKQTHITCLWNTNKCIVH